MTRSRRLGVRGRVIVAFALGAGLVSAALAVSTFFVVRQVLVDQRQASNLRQAYVNARLVRQDLGNPTSDIGDVLSTLTTANGTWSTVYRRGLWFSASATAAGGRAVPPTLMKVVLAGDTASQRIDAGGTPALVVGIPIPSLGIDYFEQHTWGDLQHTLQVLGTVLVVAACATTVGGGLFGWWASRRLVKPLADVGLAATDITEGSLDRRLPPDPDLGPLVTSFNGMVDSLQRRIERDARFASDVSHELRSPLTTIDAAVDLLEGYRSTLPPEGRRVVDTLQVEVGRFSSMVQDLLEISRLDAGADGRDVTEVPLDELVLRSASRNGGAVPVRVAPEAVGLRVPADKRCLQRAVANLLDNADAHAGGAVLVALDCDAEWATISVEDAGPGVPVEERDLVFERFYRGRAAGRRSSTTGTGLGLSLVHEHLAAHGGTVHVEDRDGGGARFVLRLPVAGP
ncbi:MAG TPA: HAMP domain-containing sensor histidine kinase [Acidimicrobiales bacterium]|nr:HAMP domain-containing sensor histidine kinase [Acidimicrobiales bacterium]